MSNEPINITPTVSDIDSGEFFMSGSKNIFEIPKYQRAYTWKKDQWQQLFDDIVDNRAGYFLGSMLCVKIEDDKNNFDKFEVVDGQQRLTTISLFLLAIHNVFKDYLPEGHMRFEEIKGYLTVKVSTLTEEPIIFSRIVPQVNEDNRQNYLKLLASELDLDIATDTKKKTSSILSAFKFFKEHLNEYLESFATDAEKSVAVDKILKKLLAARMVRIEVDNYADAYVLFEALNNRGVQLALRDLLKNQLLAGLSAELSTVSHLPDTMNTYLKLWNNDITGKISADGNKKINRRDEERFFRQIYNAYFRTWIKKYPHLSKSLTVAERSNLLKMYETLINDKTVKISDFMKDLAEAAKFYSQVHIKDEKIFDDKTDTAFADVRHIEGGISGTLLIYLMKNQVDLQLTPENFRNICDTLVKFFVRRSFTNKPRTSSLDGIFSDFIKDVEEKNLCGCDIENNLRETLKAALIKVNSTDEDFEKALKGNVYEGKPQSDYKTKFILGKIAADKLDVQARKTFVKELWAKKTKYSIEHIMPQTLYSANRNKSADPDYWIRLLGDDAEKLHEQNVHKLGNLTLTQYNSEMSNKSFPEKKFHEDKNGNLNGLALLKENGGLNGYVYDQTDWTPENIQQRTNDLVEKILKMFEW